jgi:hypothetical protein
MDAAAERALQQVAHAGDDVVEVEHLRFEPLPAREGEQLVGQLCAALGRGAGVAEPLLDAAVDALLVERPLDNLDIAEHDGQQVVEVVRHARGQLADRLEPLHLAELRLHPLALVDLGQ